MNLADVCFYIAIGSIYFLLGFLAVQEKWPHLIHGKKFKKKRKHRLKTF